MLASPGSSRAQKGLSHYKFRVGFFTGPVSYIGDYNPWILGSAYNVSEDITPPGYSNTGKADFGMWTKAMLKPYLYLRGNAHFGSLTYNWNRDGFNYMINSSYSSIGLLLETVAFPGSVLQPYLSSGIKRFNYEVPPPISQPPLNQYTVSEFGQNKSALMIPVNVGLNFQVSHLSNFFVEASLSLSNTDDIDNLSLPASAADMRYSNDALFSLRFGVGMSLIDIIKTQKPERRITKTSSYRYPVDNFAKVPPLSIRMTPDSLVPRDSIDAAKRRLASKQKQQEYEDLEDPEDRDIQLSQEVQKVRQMQQKLKEQNETDDGEDWQEMRDRVPRIDVKQGITDLPPEAIGVVTVDPPQGYYIQVFASAGPQSAQNARETAIRLVSDLLANPRDRVIITKRKRYYEVQIGVFDSYERTIKILEEVKGTFDDAFTLMYIRQ